jgi:cytochrome c oxidase subunit 4
MMTIFNGSKDIRTLTISWGLLLLLTLTAAVLSQLNINPSGLILLVLAITVFKSRLVVDVFMGLKTVDYRWRGLMLAYVVIIPFIMGCIYLTATNG